MTTRKSVVFNFVVAGIAAAVTAAIGHFGLPEIPSAQAYPLAPPAAAAPLAPQASRPLPDIATLVEQFGPAVVNIKVSEAAKPQAELPDELKDSPFGDFFRRFAPQGPSVPMRGEGSGFIVSPDGVVLTNAHVVDGASNVTVRLTDGREFAATVTGVDKKTDVAVLRIAAKNLPTVKIGDPARTRVGEWVVAIGSPYGFENSVTAGIVSAKSRSLPDENYVPFIQTDAAVNPGNSGGPLFNLAGEVIGINSQIYTRTGGYQGLSFAIPIDVAMKVEGQLLAYGRVSRAQLGVTVQEVDKPIAESFGLAKPEGALVSSVEKGEPAAKAGLQPGDIILKFNGHAIGSSRDLPLLVGAATPGSKADLEVWRKGGRLQLSAKLGELTEATVAQAAQNKVDAGRLGVAVRALTAQERRQADVDSGLVIEGVNGPAANAGLQPGDLILSLNGKPVNTPEELRALVGKGGRTVALLVQRDGGRQFVAVPLG